MAIEQPLHTNYEKPRYTEPLSITLAPRRCSAASQLSRGVLQIFSLIAAATAKVIVHTHTHQMPRLEHGISSLACRKCRIERGATFVAFVGGLSSWFVCISKLRIIFGYGSWWNPTVVPADVGKDLATLFF
jgi:hypothetical protein